MNFSFSLFFGMSRNRWIRKREINLVVIAENHMEREIEDFLVCTLIWLYCWSGGWKIVESLLTQRYWNWPNECFVQRNWGGEKLNLAILFNFHELETLLWHFQSFKTFFSGWALKKHSHFVSFTNKFSFQTFFTLPRSYP